MATVESESGNWIQEEINIMVTARHLRIAHIGCVALAIGLSFTLIGASAQAPHDGRAAVLAANAQFYAAINAMFTGDVRPIEGIWSHADDVTNMGPNGQFDDGWSTVLKDWKSQAALKLGGHVEPVEIHVVAGQDIAVVSDYEQGENTNANGKVQHVKLRATNIFRREGSQWKVVGHHTDRLSYLAR